MSLETTIASLVSAANDLTAAVTGKMAQIDQKVAQATSSVPAVVRAEVVKSLYVDASNGLDTNVGTSAAPLKTIKAALDRTISGGVSTIFLRRGQIYEVGGPTNNVVGGKSISFLPYGAEAARPIIRGIITSWAGDDAVQVCSAFMGGTRFSLRFSDIRIETGLDGGKTLYGPSFGGLISRAGGDSESANFEIYFHKCDIQIQDVPLFTTYYGFMSLSFANSTVTRAGKQTKIVASDLPKMVDITSVGIVGFGSGATVEGLFSLNAGGYISKQVGATIAP